MKTFCAVQAVLALLGASHAAVPAAERPTEESFIPNYNAASLYYLWGSEAGLEDVPGADMSVRETGFLTQYPVWRNESHRFTAGVRYRWNQLDFSAPTPFGDGVLDLHRLQIPLNYWHGFNEQWKFWAGFEPGLYSDFAEVSDDAFSATALAVAAWQFHPEWSLSFGAYYSRDLGEDRVLPVLGVIWRPNVHWNISATFPRFRVAYAPNENWVFEALIRPGGSTWNIRTANGQNRDLEYTTWQATIGVERLLTRRFGGKWIGFVESGLGFARELKLTTSGDDLFTSDLEENLILSGGIRLRF